MNKDTPLCGCAVVTLLVKIYILPHIKRNLTKRGQKEEKAVLRIIYKKCPNSFQIQQLTT
jgi:hypothetical protein